MQFCSVSHSDKQRQSDQLRCICIKAGCRSIDVDVDDDDDNVVCSVAGGQVLAEGGGNGRQEMPQAYSTLRSIMMMMIMHNDDYED